jgi:(R,R)-butanediol dehydrogenase/meso-butanediol dehydrogenase/diacetyl reductase
MRAAVFYGKENIRVEEVPEPATERGEVKIKVAANGICGSDLHVYFGAMGGIEGGDTQPSILGHEFAGEVAEVGADVTDLRPGDAVTVEPIISCDKCPSCLAGDYNVCYNVGFYGTGQGHNGGLAEYAVVARKNVHRLPDGVSLRDGALAEPLSVAYHGVEKGQVSPGQSVAVFGAGPIGIGVYLSLRAKGVEDIFVVEPSASRRHAIQGLGAEVVLDPSDGDVVAAIKERTRGAGVDVAFEAAGAPSSFTAALGATRRLGRVVIVAIHEKPVDFSPLHLIFTEQVITGVLAYKNDFEPVLRLMAEGKFPTTGWVDLIALDDVVDQGFLALRAARANKVLVALTK